MIVRAPSFSALLAACNSLHPQISLASQSSTSWRRGTRHTHQQHQTRNNYATVAGDSRDTQHDRSETSSEGEHVWPPTPKGQSCPTPYQILGLKENGTYTKARYYQLVKLYHPDANGRSNARNGVSDKIKMERYRLIVSAHTILSDPVKRSAYDRFGAGWNGRSEVGETTSRNGDQQPGPFSHNWADPSDPVWQNATWEDWERWRERRDGVYPQKTAPVYMANSYFLAVVVAFAIIGSSLNYGRAQDAGTYFVEQRDIVHDKSAKDLRRVRQEAMGMGAKQDRIEYFLRNREATLGAYDPELLREEKASRVLRDQEVCRSEGVKESNG